MAFRPQVNDQLTINGVTYSIAEHPAAPGVPYGQAGRRAIVYQLVSPSPSQGEGQGGGLRALKVFSRRFRTPALVLVAQNLALYASLPGLRVCRREVITPERNSPLLQQHPDLAYAVLMPWIEGPTWMETMIQKQALTPAESLALARSLVEILARMEEKELAHCDLSGPNVMLPPEGGVALVDVEEMYGPEFERPEVLPSGSGGYGHRTAGEGLWGSHADRFAGAVLLAEMLGWCDERVREAAWGEQYFDKEEMQQEGERYRLLVEALREHWGERAAALFERAWQSEMLQDCPTFGEWLVTLPEEAPTSGVRGESTHAPTAAGDATLRALMDLARRFEERGEIAVALETYRQAQAAAPTKSSTAEELALIVQDLKEQLQNQRQLSPEEVELAQLFDDGLAAYENGRWAKARELLGEVKRMQPGYKRGGREVKNLLAEVEKQMAPPRPKVPAWAWVSGGLAVLALVVGLAVKFGFGMQAGEATPTLSPTNTPTLTPFPSHTPTRTPRPTATATGTLRPSPTVTEEPTPTPAPTRVTAAAPTLALPEQGQTYQSPVTFQWQGTLGAGQTYWVRVWHTNSGFSLDSPSLSTTSWTSALPGDKFGEWRWNVSVLQNGSVVATSHEGMFWFNPFPGGGGSSGGGGGGEEPTSLPPTSEPPPP